MQLTRYSLVKTALRSRWPQLVLRAFTLGIFLLAILAGFVGTPVGNRNIAIVLVWIAWWGLLALLAVPLFGRGWCSICPIPMPGEWLQQGSLLEPTGKGYGLRRRWPNPLRNIWVQNGAFLLLALFSAVILTVPRVSALVLAAFLLVAIAASLIFERRAFCRYLCPVGGFIGLVLPIRTAGAARDRRQRVRRAHREDLLHGQQPGLWLSLAGIPRRVDPQHELRSVYGVPAHLPAR